MARKLSDQELSRLLVALEQAGYQLIGPALREGCIVIEEISASQELPRGWVDHQAPGRYRLEPTGDRKLFQWVTGPGSFKRFLHPPEASLFRLRKTPDRLVFEPSPVRTRPLALIGARACDLAAIAIQDRVLLEHDPIYRANRRDMFVLAVQCGRSGELCFCASTGSGPRAEKGYDLALTELADDLLVEVGSERGQSLLDQVSSQPARPGDLAEARAIWEATAASQVRALAAETVRRRLPLVPEHPRWKEVADRCLTCGNCTMVCPTCFCTTTRDKTELGQMAERERVWDSCFSLEFSHLHGANVRESPRARYRQWLTHKLASWHDQFDTPGCVGCGRCIAWCPVGIDILEEARALCESPQ